MMFEYRINKTVGKLFVASLLASLLTACAGSSLTQIKPTDALEPDKGLVIIRIINNVDFVSQNFDRSWGNIAIRLKTNDEDRRFGLTKALSTTMKSTQLFIGQLPQGTYDLLELRVISGWKNLTHEAWLPLDKLGTFKIIPGHITNLGTIICQPVDGRRYQFIYLNNNTEVQELVKNNYPVIFKAATEKTMIDWDNKSLLENIFITPSDYPKNLESKAIKKDVLYKTAALSVAKANSAGFNNPKQIATGEIFAGSKLGQVVVKERDGKWTQLDTGYMHEIISVLPINRNTIFVGGEEGLLLVTNDGGRSWKRIEAPLKTSIDFLEKVNDKFFIGGDVFSNLFYETRDIYSSNWKAISAIKPNNADQIYSLRLNPSKKLNYPEYSSYINKEKFYLFIPYSNTIYILDLATNIWSTIKTPHFVSGNIYSHKNGFFYNVDPSFIHENCTVRVSHDFGNSWVITYDDCYGIAFVLYSPVFKDEHNAFVLRVTPIGKNVTLRASLDGGKQWSEVNDFNDLKLPYPTKLFYDYVNNKLYFAVNGMIYIASDDLQTWTRVR